MARINYTIPEMIENTITELKETQNFDEDTDITLEFDCTDRFLDDYDADCEGVYSEYCIDTPSGGSRDVVLEELQSDLQDLIEMTGYEFMTHPIWITYNGKEVIRMQN